jgi:hypothetical protein
MFRRHRSVTGFHQVQAYGEAQKKLSPKEFYPRVQSGGQGRYPEKNPAIAA